MNTLSVDPLTHIFKFATFKELTTICNTSKIFKCLIETRAYQQHFNKKLTGNQMSQEELRKHCLTKYICNNCEVLNDFLLDVHFRGDVILKFCEKCATNLCSVCTYRCKKRKLLWFMQSKRIDPRWHCCGDDQCINEDCEKQGYSFSLMEFKVDNHLLFNGWTVNSYDLYNDYDEKIPSFSLVYDKSIPIPTTNNMFDGLMRSFEITNELHCLLAEMQIFKFPEREAGMLLHLLKVTKNNTIKIPTVDELFAIIKQYAYGPLHEMVMAN